MPKIEEQNKSTLEYTMHYGALLGIFWMIKYAFLIGQEFWEHFIYFFHMLNVVSPLLMYIFYLKYRAETPEIKHNVIRCMIFVLGICLFGSLFESAIMYAHYTYISPDFFAQLSSGFMEMLDSMVPAGQLTGNELVRFNEMADNVSSNKLLYLVSNTMGNLFLGFVFSLLIGLLTRNRNLQ